MRVKHSILGMIGVLAWMLVAVFTIGPAQAAAPSTHHAAGIVLTAPPAPSGTVSALAAAATAPTISPSVTTGHVAAGGSYTCPYKDLCALPWDPTTGSWKIFYLYDCAKYAVSYWDGTGYYLDNQTTSAVSAFYNQSSAVLSPPGYFTADGTGRVQQSYNWTPVWYIRNC
jgi:hypothetical protein